MDGLSRAARPDHLREGVPHPPGSLPSREEGKGIEDREAPVRNRDPSPVCHLPEDLHPLRTPYAESLEDPDHVFPEPVRDENDLPTRGEGIGGHREGVDGLGQTGLALNEDEPLASEEPGIQDGRHPCSIHNLPP